MNQEAMIPVKAGSILEKDLRDEIVIMTEDGNVIHTLDGSACFIWRQIDGIATLETLAERVTAEYETILPTAKSDLSAFLSELVSLGLVTFRQP